MSPPISSAIRVLDLHPTDDDLESEVLRGLTCEQKMLSPKYFYDATGADLFEQITRQPEYYPTETEIGIMQRRAAEIADITGPTASLIEFGSGSGLKTRILLDHMDLAAYVPVDISRDQLEAVAVELNELYPRLEILPVCADFTQPFQLPQPKVMPERNVVFFPGSTIGNFYPGQAESLLKVMSRIACKGGALIIGVDLKKDKGVLERAYNDEAGITAEFNLNMLVRMNRELGADFRLDQFHHRAIYNEEMGRIEMHLVSDRDQVVHVAGKAIAFRRDEYILTECSHKYSLDQFAGLAGKAGFEVQRVWTDERELFSVQYLVNR